MVRQRKLSPERKAFINSLLEYCQPNDANDVKEMIKDLLGDTLQGMLEAEMDQKFGYSTSTIIKTRLLMTVETSTVRRPLPLLSERLNLIFQETGRVSLTCR